MNRWAIAFSAFIAGIGITVAYSVRAEQPAQPPAALRAQPAPAAAPNDADRAAILKTARDFEAAFAKGDAKALAAMYTENGESREADPVDLFKAASPRR